MVDPSVHSYNLNLSESDDSSDVSHFGSNRNESSSCKEDDATSTLGRVHRSRSRTRRLSANSAVQMKGSQKQHTAYDSKHIDKLPEEGSSSASSSSSGDSPSSQSSSSGGEAMQSSSKKILKKNSEAYTYSESSGSEHESIQSSPKATCKEKSNSDTGTEPSCLEDEPMKSSPNPTSKGESTTDSNNETSCSEGESMQPEGKSNSDTNTGTSEEESEDESDGSEDEPMQSSPTPTLEGKSTPEANTGFSNSEDESMQSSPKSNSNEKSKDEPMQSSPKSTLKEISTPKTISGSSRTPDESMQSSLKSTSEEKSKSDANSEDLCSEDELIHGSPKPKSKELFSTQNELFEQEKISSNSEDENERVVAELSGMHFDNEIEKCLHEKNPETVEDQHKKVLGDKLTVKFKVTLPEIESELPGGSLQFLRVPQFIPVESGAFDADTFKDSMTSDDLKDEQSRGDFLNRLKATVRWRENKDNIKESNARIVRWSDGSETFHVGAEVFDVMHHKVIDDKNHLYVRLDSCYQPQGSITDKMTLRPKLDSTFGQSHVQGLRNRAMNKPQTGVVKVLSDLVANPLADRDRRAKEEIANLRREEREKRRDIQMSMRKPRVKPMRHCTADDSDPEQPTGEQDDLESVSAQSLSASSTGPPSTIQGIRTNRNVAVNPRRLESTDEEDDEGGYESDVNDIINDGDLDGDDEEMSDEPSTSTSKSKKAPPSHHSSKSDSEDGPKKRIPKRNTKRVIYSDSDSD